MKIREVTVTVDSLSGAADFYGDVLRLPVEVGAGRAEVTVGSSRLVLRAGEPFQGVHHLAFGIRPADVQVARTWLEERVALIPDDGSVVIDGPAGWNSRSFYFLGPEDILLELIARDADATAEGGGGAAPRMLNISEVGIAVPDVAAAVRTLTQDLLLPTFPPQGPGFAPVGNHDGLLIVVDQDRTWFPSYHASAAQGPLMVHIEAPRAASLRLTSGTTIVAA